ncbi:MAG: nuclear transport factor 2 family protein [Rhodospirillales bacterium]|nr:nuclear transport factor 2 family protein [Rhodospirillales bacterium]
MDTEVPSVGPLGRLIHAFYDARREARRSGDLSLLAPFLAADVRWSEPDVGDHMGFLKGPDAVIDMIGRALAATDGSFELGVSRTVETGSHVAALIVWSATRDGREIEGREMVVYEVQDGCIASAWFYPENIADDQAFWGE